MTILYPVVKDGVHARQISDGVVIRGSSSAFKIKGRGLYEFYVGVLNTLTGSVSLEQIREALSEKQRLYFERFFEQLEKYRMVSDAKKAEPSMISDDMYRKYGATIEYIKEKTDNYEEIFLNWTTRKMVVWGSGNAYEAFCDLLFKSGHQQIQIPIGRFGIVDDAIESPLKVTASNIDFEVLGSDNLIFTPDVTHIIMLDTEIENTKTAITGLLESKQCLPIEIVVKDGIGIIGPDPKTGTSSMKDFYERGIINKIESPAFGFTSRTFFKALAARTFVEFIDQMAEPGRLNFVDRAIIVKEDLSTEYCPLFPVARGVGGRQPDHSGIPRTSIEDQEDDRFGQIYKNTELLFHPTGGIFKRREYSGILQVPFYHVEIDVNYPLVTNAASDSVVSWGFDFKDACVKATLLAMECYVKRVDSIQNGKSRSDSYIVDIDYDTWFLKAIANPLKSRLEGQGKDISTVIYQVDFSGCEDLEVLQLYKILRVYVGDSFRVELSSYPDFKLNSAVVYVNDQIKTSAQAFNPKHAIQQAMGDLISLYQLAPQNIESTKFHQIKHSSTRRVKYAEMVSHSCIANCAGEVKSILSSQGVSFREHMFEEEASFSSCGFYAGYISVD